MKKTFILFAAFLVCEASVFSQPALKSVDESTQYNFEYELYGGENSPANKNKYEENSTVKLENPTKEGYDFLGWYWDYNFESIVEDSTISGKSQDIKVYARWEYSASSTDSSSSNMVTIIPVGHKVELQDFAGTNGTVVINAYSICKFEVTQELYQSVMGSNPSRYGNSNYPVERVSWFDAIYFCNKYSEKSGLEPVYKINGKTDVTEWNYTPHRGYCINGKIEQDTTKNGYRLPTRAEWEMAARGGLEGGWDCTYSGSNNIDEVAWHAYSETSRKSHEVGLKQPNAAGLYDMSGNVWEWVWDSTYSGWRTRCGGSITNDSSLCGVEGNAIYRAENQDYNLGFRIVCSLK